MRGDKNKTYVLQVGGGRENRAIQLIEGFVPHEAYSEVYAPKFKRKMKLKGEWRVVESLLIPGYLFIVTSDVDALRLRLYDVPALTKLLQMGTDIVPLEPEEVDWINRFTKPFERTVGFSEGYMVGDRVIVTSGPLMGYESKIVKIDRHKRFAYLRFRILGRSKDVKVGLEIVSRLRATGTE